MERRAESACTALGARDCVGERLEDEDLATPTEEHQQLAQLRRLDRVRRELRQLLKRRSQRRALCDGVVGVEETRRELSVEEPLEEPAFVRHKRRPKRLSRQPPQPHGRLCRRGRHL